jgi:hypothetical protein
MSNWNLRYASEEHFPDAASMLYRYQEMAREGIHKGPAGKALYRAYIHRQSLEDAAKNEANSSATPETHKETPQNQQLSFFQIDPVQREQKTKRKPSRDAWH